MSEQAQCDGRGGWCRTHNQALIRCIAELRLIHEREIADLQARVLDEDEQTALEWLGDRVRDGRGPVTFAMTENGNIGLLLFADPADESAKCDGSGDEVIEAILTAIKNRPEFGPTGSEIVRRSK